MPDSFPSPKDSRQDNVNVIQGHEQTSFHSRCAVTNSACLCQKAHIIPKARETWFDKNAVVTFLGGDLCGIDGDANFCHLRLDIHHAFDECVPVFALAPEAACWVVHALQASENSGWRKFTHEYHNLQVPPRRLAHISRECLFAHFALSVFSLVKSFVVVAPLGGRVAGPVLNPDRDGCIINISELSSGELKDRYSGCMSKGSSSAKRRRVSDDSSTRQSLDVASYQWLPQFTEGHDRDSDIDTWYIDNVVNTRGEFGRGRPLERARGEMD